MKHYNHHAKRTVQNCQAAEIVKRYARLMDSVTVTVSPVSGYGDVQVEIRHFGVLVWHAWSFEPDFLTRLEANLLSVQQN